MACPNDKLKLENTLLLSNHLGNRQDHDGHYSLSLMFIHIHYPNLSDQEYRIIHRDQEYYTVVFLTKELLPVKFGDQILCEKITKNPTAVPNIHLYGRKWHLQ